MTSPAETPKPTDVKTRPLSPHLQVYRPQITSVLSILHRLTGCALAVGTALMAWFFISLLGGAESFQIFQAFAQSLPGTVVLAGWSAALFYHLLNGVRHLFWDAGYGYSIKTVTTSGIAVLLGTVLLTGVTFGAVFYLNDGRMPCCPVKMPPAASAPLSEPVPTDIPHHHAQP